MYLLWWTDRFAKNLGVVGRSVSDGLTDNWTSFQLTATKKMELQGRKAQGVTLKKK